MKYDFLVAGIWAFMKMPFQKEIGRRYGKEYAKLLLQNSKPLYREIIGRTPSIGGLKNSLSINLIWACMLVAIYKTADKKITPEKMGDILCEAMRSSRVFAVSQKVDPFTRKYQNKWAAGAELSQSSPYAFDWRYTFIPGKDLSEFGVHYSECGICKLCQAEDCFEIARQMCKLDYVMVKSMRAELTRTKTIGNGDEICDFTYRRKT